MMDGGGDGYAVDAAVCVGLSEVLRVDAEVS